MTRCAARWFGSLHWPGCRTRFLALPAALAAVAFAVQPSLGAQEPGQDTVEVSVTLRLLDAETNAVLMGALIRLSGDPRPYVTGVDGRVSFDIPAGNYVVAARKGGYATLTSQLQVTGEEEVTLRLRRVGDVEPGLPATLLVRVREAGEGRAIEGASVTLAGGETRITDRRGNVRFATVSGPARISVEMLGYANRTEPVTVHPDATTAVSIAMTVEALVLAPIEVEVRSRFLEAHGVYGRIERGQVMRMVTREQLETHPVAFLSDAFVTVPGVTVNRAVVGETTLFGPARGNPDGCELKVYVDGMPTEMDIDAFTPEMVEMAEVYWGLRTPIQYRGPNQSNCGVVLLWTRRGGGE